MVFFSVGMFSWGETRDRVLWQAGPGRQSTTGAETGCAKYVNEVLPDTWYLVLFFSEPYLYSAVPSSWAGAECGATTAQYRHNAVEGVLLETYLTRGAHF